MAMGTHGTTPVPQLISDGEVVLVKEEASVRTDMNPHTCKETRLCELDRHRRGRDTLPQCQYRTPEVVMSSWRALTGWCLKFEKL